MTQLLHFLLLSFLVVCSLFVGSIECFVVLSAPTRTATTRNHNNARVATAPLKASPLLTPTGDFDVLSIISASEPTVSSLSSTSSSSLSSSSFSTVNLLAAATVDPTTFLSDIFAGVLGTPIILAIPIVAALLVAGLVVGFIVNYANPTEPDE